MKKLLVLFFLAFTACSAAPFGDTVTLSDNETKIARQLAEHRQDINFRVAKEQADYQAAMNRLNEEMASLNLDAGKLCFEFKKAHKLEPNKNYTLDEWGGKLILQK